MNKNQKLIKKNVDITMRKKFPNTKRRYGNITCLLIGESGVILVVGKRRSQK